MLTHTMCFSLDAHSTYEQIFYSHSINFSPLVLENMNKNIMKIPKFSPSYSRNFQINNPSSNPSFPLGILDKSFYIIVLMLLVPIRL